MAKLKLFSKTGCKLCEEAKTLFTQTSLDSISLEIYDVDDTNGLAEATFYGVRSVPTLILEDENENLIGEWRGKVPSPEEILNAIH